ncbi:MAG: DUF2953 domain-containing protein [Clostridiaceae bacterium]|nr:DUF2953 domain-containing protein [Clostridiaceae bacterium]
MWIFFSSLCIIILLIIYVLLHKWSITIKYKNEKLSIRLGVITIYSTSKKTKDRKKRFKLLETDFRGVLKKSNRVKGFYKSEKAEIINILCQAQDGLSIQGINLSITFGFYYAALTGMVNGLIWAGITAVVSLADKYLNIKKITNIAVNPTYTKSCFDICFTLMLRVRLFKMYSIAKRILQLYQKFEITSANTNKIQ